RGICPNSFLRGLLGRGQVFEALARFADTGRAAEVVDRGRMDSRLAKSLRQLLVELVQPADVWHHHYAGATRPGSPRKVSAELRPVRRGEHEISLVGGSSANRKHGRQRRTRIISMAHDPILA